MDKDKLVDRIAELEAENDHLRRGLRAARPYVSDKAGAGILFAYDAAALRSHALRHENG